jgi:hypothetical protein
MSVTIQIRRDTAANWTSVNPTPFQGELCEETDTHRMKIGDGATAWTSLAYLGLAGGQLTGSLVPKVVTLAQSGGAVAVAGGLGNDYRLTLTASGWTISNPTGMGDGQVFYVTLIQDATGSRTIGSWGSEYNWGAGNSAPTLTTTALARDVLAFKWYADDSKADFLGAAIPQGF